MNGARRGPPPVRVPSLGGDAQANAGNFRVGARVAGALLAAAPALGAGDIQGSSGLPDLDVRTGSIAATAAQRSDARSLQADVAWNQFGTPSTKFVRVAELQAFGAASRVQ